MSRTRAHYFRVERRDKAGRLNERGLHSSMVSYCGIVVPGARYVRGVGTVESVFRPCEGPHELCAECAARAKYSDGITLGLAP